MSSDWNTFNNSDNIRGVRFLSYTVGLGGFPFIENGIYSLSKMTLLNDESLSAMGINNIDKRSRILQKISPLRKSRDTRIGDIYIPRQGGDWESDDYEEDNVNSDNAPSWHRHFEPDELLDRYMPTHIIDIDSWGVRYQAQTLQSRKALEKDQIVDIKKFRRIFHDEKSAKRVLNRIKSATIIKTS